MLYLSCTKILGRRLRHRPPVRCARCRRRFNFYLDSIPASDTAKNAVRAVYDARDHGLWH